MYILREQVSPASPTPPPPPPPGRSGSPEPKDSEPFRGEPEGEMSDRVREEVLGGRSHFRRGGGEGEQAEMCSRSNQRTVPGRHLVWGVFQGDLHSGVQPQQQQDGPDIAV